MLRNWLGEVVKVEQFTQGTNLSVKRYKLDEPIDESRDRHWKQSTKFSSFKTLYCNSQSVAFEVVVSHQTGLSGPCVLLCNDDDMSGCISLAVVMVNDGNCKYGEIPINMIPSNGEYHLRDGPSVLWYNSNGLAMLSTTDTNKMTLNCFSFEQLFDIDNTSGLKCALDRVWVLSGRQEMNSLRIFTRATLSASDLNPPKKLKSVESDVLWCTATVRQQDGSPFVTRLPDNLYIHSDYAPVINCITDYDNCDPYMLNDPRHCTQYVVGTTYQQMVIFDNGRVLHHTSLECTPVTILVCQLGVSDAFIVQDGIAGVFVYTLNKTGFVLQRSWAGVFAVLIDDFVFNGNEQVLVVMDDPTRGDFSLSNFVLTDLETIEIPSPQDGMVEDQSSNGEIMNSAVTALQKRLMHEKKVLDEIQVEHQQKKQLLNKATELLACLDKGMEYNWTPDQCLVPLLEPVSTHDVPPASQFSSSDIIIGTLDVVNTWQRILDSHWIVGIIVVNNTKSPITEVAATVACTTHTEIQETKCVMFPDQPVAGGSLPVMGRTDSQLGHGQTANIVCVTELPVFTSDKIQVGMLLCWKEISGDKVQTRYAGHIQLTAEEVYNTSLCCNPVSDWCNPVTEHVCQDQMSYLVTHLIIELEFKSLFTDLRKLPHMLKTCLPLSNHIIVSADSTTPTVAPMSPTHTTASVIIIPTTTDRKYTSTIVLYKESSRFSVLLQLLRRSLPSDINMQPVEYGWRETIHRCYEQLQRHVEHLITITDEQLRTGRVPTENDIHNHKVDVHMKNVMELVENN